MSREFLETIKVEDGKIFHLPYHQLRVDRALTNSNLCLDKILDVTQEQGLFRCRVVYDEYGYEVEYYPYVKRKIDRLKLVYDDKIVYDKKYLNRDDLDRLFTQKGLADDVLIVKNGLISDTTIANCAFLYKDEWLTPKKPLLFGTTRSRLIDEGKIREAEISVDDIFKFDAIALMNAMIDFDIIRYKKIEDIIC